MIDLAKQAEQEEDVYNVSILEAFRILIFQLREQACS